MPSRLSSTPRIVFMGTPDFAVPTLKTLLLSPWEVLAVVTQPDRPKGRGRPLSAPPVKRLAQKNGIEVLQPEDASSPPFCETIRRKSPDLLVVVAFGQILKRTLLEIPSYGALNIHASLLPKYRGAAPIQWAIINREHSTGLTAMRMDQGMDTGPILSQREISIAPDETAGTLHDRLSLLAGEFLIDTLRALINGEIQEREQDHRHATYAPKISRDMAKIPWDRPAEEISALIRGLDPWPGAYTTWGGKEIKIFSPSIVDATSRPGTPGRVLVLPKTREQILVETGEGILAIGEVQMAGKRRMASQEFLKGFPFSQGAVLGHPNEQG